MEVFDEDPVRVYLREVTTTPPLTTAEEAACVRHVRAADQEAEVAATRLLEANLALVVSIAQRYPNDRVHILDLIAEGNNGLMRALKTLPDSHEESFSVHATTHIEHAIAEALAASRPAGS